MKSEWEVTEPRTLVLTYTVQQEYRVLVMPGAGSVARAVEESVRCISGQPNVDAESIRFRLEIGERVNG